MSRSFTIDINGTGYRGETAPAKAQIEMLHIAGRTGLIVSLREEAADMALVAALTQVKLDDVRTLANLCLKGDMVTRAADKVPVGENLFQDAPQDYYLLLGRVLTENLGPFWQLRQATKSSEAEPVTP